MKKLQNLVEAKALSKKEQQSIKGGIDFPRCDGGRRCPVGYGCVGTICLPIPV